MICQSVEEKFIFEQLCQRVENKTSHLSAIYCDSKTMGNNENLDFLWKDVDEHKSISYYRLLKSNRKVIGKGMVFAKRVIRKLLKWLIAPICENQSFFNSLITHLCGATINELRQLGENFALSDIKIQLLQEQVELLKTECAENQKQTLYQREKNLAELLSLKENIELCRKENEQLRINMEQTKSEFAEHKKQNSLNDMDKNTLVYQATLVETINTIPNDYISFAQAGEDRIISNLLFARGIRGFESTYLDVGANHALNLSNTYFFYMQGARGVLVEANPQLVKELKILRPNDIIIDQCVSTEGRGKVDFFIISGDGLSTTNLETAQKKTGEASQFQITETVQVETISINQIIAQYFKEVPHILSVDIEDDTFSVLQSLDLERYRPLVIIVETLLAGTNSFQRDMQIVSYMKKNLYEEVAFTGINSIFVNQKN